MSERSYHWSGLKITDEFVRIRIGRILAVEYGDEPYIDECPFKIGDSIEHSNDDMIPELFRITRIECFSNMMTGQYKHHFGLIVRKI